MRIGSMGAATALLVAIVIAMPIGAAAAIPNAPLREPSPEPAGPNRLAMPATGNLSQDIPEPGPPFNGSWVPNPTLPPPSNGSDIIGPPFNGSWLPDPTLPQPPNRSDLPEPPVNVSLPSEPSVRPPPNATDDFDRPVEPMFNGSWLPDPTLPQPPSSLTTSAGASGLDSVEDSGFAEDLGTRPSSQASLGDGLNQEATNQGLSGPAVVSPDPYLSLLVRVALAAGAGLAAVLILYRRVLEEDDLLAHDLRNRMVELVKDEPGINEKALADRLDVHPSTVAYHARLLEKGDMIIREAQGRETLHYCNGGHTDSLERTLRRAVRREAKRRVISTCQDHPGLSVSEVADELECHPSTVTRHADCLVEQGILADQQENGRRCLEVAPEIEERISRLLRE